MENMLNKKIFFAGGDGDGCFHYRTKLPATFLEQKYSAGYFETEPDRDEADIVILQRATNEYFLTEIPRLQAQGKKVLYDIDDNLWVIPATNAASGIYNTKTLKLTKKIISICDGLIVSTEPLKTYFQNNEFNNKIFVIPNFLEDVFPERMISDTITVGFCGTNTHRGDFDYRLVDVLRKLKGKVKLVFVGYNPIKGFEDSFIPWIKTENYHNEVYKMNIDIALGPLEDNEFNKSKSNLKWLEFGAMGSCFVGSDVYPYSKSILDGITGVTVNNTRNWAFEINDLIEHPEDIKKIGNNAREIIEKYYTYKYNGQVIIDLYNEVLSSI
jgi:glycosyltransferase involved in cell wall biosynthesis